MQEKKILCPAASAKAIKSNLVSLKPSKRAINNFKHSSTVKRKASRINLERKKTEDPSWKTAK